MIDLEAMMLRQSSRGIVFEVVFVSRALDVRYQKLTESLVYSQWCPTTFHELTHDINKRIMYHLRQLIILSWSRRVNVSTMLCSV